MNESILISRIIFILITAISIGVAFWVYRYKRSSDINRTFFLYTIFYTFWIIFGYLANTTQDVNLSLIFIRLRFAAVSFCAITVYSFAMVFPRKEKIHPYLNRIVLSGGIIFAVLSIVTNLIIKNVEFKSWGTNIIFGSGALFFFAGIVILAFIIPTILYRKYLVLSKSEKLQTQYFLVGIIIFIIANLIFNVFFPTFQKTYQYYQIGDYSAIFLLGFTAYAIVRQNLFGIKVVLTQILVGVIAILLFVQILDSKTKIEYIWKSALFLIFLIFGYLLIQSVIREIKRREELQMLYEQVDQLSKAKSEFLSIVSHQLRTPLTAVKGYISMILDGDYGQIPAQVRTKLQNVFLSNEKLISFINDLLNVSRIERGKIELQTERGNIQEVVTQEIEELEAKAQEKGLYLKLEKPKEKLPEMLMDAGKIKQVVANLIDNSIKYTEHGGITVAMEKLNEKIRITISDTGAGMGKDEISRLFESFTRGTAGTQMAHEGLGIGLYIAKKFVELHEGKLWAESEGKNKGSTFFIELPIK